MKIAPACLILALGAGSACAQLESSPHRAGQAETITVSGIGKSSVVPDRVAFTVGAQTVAETVEAAINQNNEKVARIIAALKSAGAQKQELQTSRFSIVPQQDHRQGALPRILGYHVSNAITVRSQRAGEAGRLLQAAVKAGANTASAVHFEVSDPAKGRDEALRAAFADAQAQAAVLARAAGRTLGRALSISDGRVAVPPPQPYARAMAMSAETGEVPVTPGVQETTYSIGVVFELR